MKKRMTQAQFQQIRRWVLRNGRPLEWARWQALFEGGSRNQAAEVLSGYQNADGGFGWGLEPDCMNPKSSPYQTGSALALAEALQPEQPAAVEEFPQPADTASSGASSSRATE